MTAIMRATSTITSRYGSAFTPVKDGKWLVYGSRFEDKTGLADLQHHQRRERWRNTRKETSRSRWPR